MEKIKNHIEKKILPTVIYADEANEIITEIAKLCDRVRISTPEYRLEVSDKIEELVEEKTKIDITGQEPYICLSLGGGHASLSYSDEVPVSVVNKIERTLENGRSVWRKIAGSWWPLGIFCALFMSAGNISPEILQPIMTPYLILMALTLPFAITHAYWMFCGGFYYVKTQPRNLAPNFFKKNKDQILVGTIIAVISVGLTWLVTSPQSPFGQTQEAKQIEKEVNANE